MTNLEIILTLLKSVFILITPLLFIPIIDILVIKTSAMTFGQRGTFSSRTLLRRELAILFKQITRTRVIESNRKSILVSVIALTLLLTSFAAFPLSEPIYISFKKYYWELISSKTAVMYILLSVLISNLMIIGNDGADAEDKAQYFIVSKTTRILISGLVMIFSLLSMFFYYGTVDVHILIQNQADTIGYIFPKWGLFVQPISAILFIFSIVTLRASGKTNMVLSNNIDSVEKRNYAVDGINRITLRLSELSLMGLFTIIYLGGYNSLVNVSYVNDRISHGLYILQALSFIFKLLATYLLYIWVIKALPQFKYYRLIEDTINRILPLSVINLFITILFFYFGNA